jgi:hypothetical protein
MRKTDWDSTVLYDKNGITLESIADGREVLYLAMTRDGDVAIAAFTPKTGRRDHKVETRSIPYGPKGLLGSQRVELTVVRDGLHGADVYLALSNDGRISIAVTEAS